MKTLIINALPGFGEILQKSIMRGILKLASFVFTILLSHHFWSWNGVAFALIVVIASNIYRWNYKNYLSEVRRNLSALGSGNLTIVGSMSQEQLCTSIIKRPQWWIPILNWPVLPIAFLALFITFLANETEFSFLQMFYGYPAAVMVMQGLFSPNWELLDDAIFIYAKQTVETALLGTAAGMIVSLPISFFAARNLMSTNRILIILYYVTRSIMVVIRAIPTFLLGLIFVALVGIGPFPGVLAIFVFSIGIMTKLYSEIIEGIDQGPLDGVAAVGANLWQVILFSVVPQAIPGIIATTLYCAEINIHSATVLGLIGAEGIGLPIHEYLSSLSYSNAATFIVVTIVLTVIVDYTSAFVRSRIK